MSQYQNNFDKYVEDLDKQIRAEAEQIHFGNPYQKGQWIKEQMDMRLNYKDLFKA